jgi:hypothetical protein
LLLRHRPDELKLIRRQPPRTPVGRVMPAKMRLDELDHWIVCRLRQQRCPETEGVGQDLSGHQGHDFGSPEAEKLVIR